MILEDHPANLNKLQHSCRARSIAETVLPDTRTIVDDHIIADQRRKYGSATGDRTVATNPNVGSDDRARTNIAA